MSLGRSSLISYFTQQPFVKKDLYYWEIHLKPETQNEIKIGVTCKQYSVKYNVMQLCRHLVMLMRDLHIMGQAN